MLFKKLRQVQSYVLSGALNKCGRAQADLAHCFLGFLSRENQLFTEN
jgi:hypothetical protein